MTPGDDMHLTLLMAPHNLNLVTGQDRQHLLAFGRAAFEAGQKCKGCSVPPNGLHQIAEPSHSMSQYASKDDMLKAVMAENEQLRAQLAAAQPVFSHMELRADGSHGAGRAVAVDAMGREMPSYNPTAAAQQGVQPAWFVQLTKYGEPVQHLLPEIAEKCRADIEKIGGTLQPLYTHPTTQGLERQKIDPLRQMIAQHQAHLEQSPYAYFELAYTRQTGWMVWITDKPAFRQSEIVNPDRKVLWHGQGDTPDEACEKAAQAAQAKQAEAMEVSRSGGCGCCSNACADRSDGCRHVNENPSAADMREKVNRYCGCGMCLETDKEHEPSCHRSVSQAKQGGAA